MSVLTLNVDEVMRTLSNDGQYPFVENDKTVDIVRFALNTGFTDVVLDENSALRVMYQRPGETQTRAQTLTYYDTDGLHNYYDWQLLSADLAEKGTLTVALCIVRVADGDVEEWHTTPCQIRVLDTIHTDDSDEGDESITPTVAQRVAVLESMIQRVASGAPIVVASASAMTDTDQIYVLTTDGNWYYYNGSAWVAGGEYGAVATDTTLTQSGIPADAKTVGDKFDIVGDKFDDVENILNDSGKILKLYRKSFTAIASTEHGSTTDVLTVDIPAMTEYTLNIEVFGSITGNVIVIEYHADGTSRSIKQVRLPSKISAIAEKHTTGIGLYFAASAITSDSTISIEIYVAENVIDLAEMNKSRIEGISNEIKLIEDEVFKFSDNSFYSSTGYRLNINDGLAHQDASYAGRVFAVTAGDVIKVFSPDRFQFQTDSGFQPTIYKRVGNITYGSGIYYITVPNTATKLVACYLVGGELPTVTKIKSSKVENISDNIDYIEDHIQCYKKVFIAAPSVEHSSLNDQIAVNIQSGASYTVNISSDVSTSADLIVSEFYAGGTSATIGTVSVPATVSATAANNVTAIGLYWSSSFISENATIIVEVIGETESVENERINVLEEKVEFLSDKTGYYHHEFSVEAGVEHSSTRDKAIVNILEGETYSITVSHDGGITGYISINQWLEDNTSVSAGAISTNPSTTKITATGHVVGIGLWIAASIITSDTNITIDVSVEKPSAVVDALSADMVVVKNNLGILHTSYNEYIGTEHSGATPVFDVDFAAGTTLTITATRTSHEQWRNITFYSFDANSNRTELGSQYYDTTHNYILASDTTGIGWYHGASSNDGDGVVDITIVPSTGLSGMPERIKTVESDFYGDIPSYLATEFSDTLEKIKAECTERSYLVCFVTDTHYGKNGYGASNWNVTIRAVHAINNNYPVDALIHGGDYTNGNRVADETWSLIDEIREGILRATKNSYMLIGNHDDNSYYLVDGVRSRQEANTEGERYAGFQRYFTKDVVDPYGHGYFYYDVPNLNLRIICLCALNGTDMGYSNEQLAWVRDNALNTTYQVAFFSHASLTKEYNSQNTQLPNGAEIRTIIESFISNGGVVVGFFHGHTHWDYLAKYSVTNGFYECCTGCSKEEHDSQPSYIPSGATWYTNRTHETVNQELFDFIIIKPYSRRVKLIRFGAGVDREFAY